MDKRDCSTTRTLAAASSVIHAGTDTVVPLVRRMT
jgi:hypothetical protein